MKSIKGIRVIVRGITPYYFSDSVVKFDLMVDAIGSQDQLIGELMYLECVIYEANGLCNSSKDNILNALKDNTKFNIDNFIVDKIFKKIIYGINRYKNVFIDMNKVASKESKFNL